MKYSTIIICLFVALSCSIDGEAIIANDTVDETTISIQEATDNLNQFIRSVYGDTRSSDSLFATSISSTIKVKDLFCETKSIDMNLNPDDPCVYLFNNENHNGCAVVSANKKIKPDIIAVIEKGYITDDFIVHGESASFSEKNLSVFLKELLLNSLSYVSDNTIKQSDEEINTRSNDTLCVVAPFFPNWWNQWAPFNNYCPANCPAGCVAVAASMAVTYLKRNDLPFLLYGRVIDFSEIQDAYKPYNLTYDYVSYGMRDTIAWIISCIGQSLHTTYSSTGSNSDLVKVANYLDSLGYNASRKLNFKVSYATSMLPQGKPIVMTGFSNVFFANGHSWLVDGIYQYWDMGGSPKYTLLHCNWGWGGLGNGYYSSKAFTPNSGSKMWSPYNGPAISPADSLHDHNYYHRTVVY